jgi:EAL domain-containing protein (putative c-di-GMP-specific phosphodiesterase class I)
VKARGIDVSLDDFGTGYSSLAALKDLPVDELKIDRSFVAGHEEEDASLSIIMAITHLAEGFGLRTVAEGVETGAQLERCREAGCHELQGYHLARPMSAADLAAQLRAGHWPPPQAATSEGSPG